MPFDYRSRILITGGTGSFGRAFIAEALRRQPDIQRLVVYSRDELKQWELAQQFRIRPTPIENSPRPTVTFSRRHHKTHREAPNETQSKHYNSHI